MRVGKPTIGGIIFFLVILSSVVSSIIEGVMGPKSKRKADRPQARTVSKKIPPQAETYLRAGSRYLKNQEWGKATTAYEKAAEYIKDNPRLYHYLAWLYAKDGQLTKALDYVDKALKLKPDYPEAYELLGSVYANQNKYTLARQEYKKAIELFGAQGKVAQAKRVEKLLDFIATKE